MPTSRSISLALLCAGFLGCSEAPLQTIRPDSGFALRDAGSGPALAFSPGDEFPYYGRLSFRDGTAGEADLDSSYCIRLRIDSVDDRGTAEASRLEVVADGANRSVGARYSAPIDSDFWVGRVGPSLAADQVSSAPSTVVLDGPPTLPSRPAAQKTLPQAESFFLDMRNIDALRTDFVARHAERQPTVEAPTDDRPTWRFRYVGQDDRLDPYPEAQRFRDLTLTYSASGHLVQIDERVGDSDVFPHAANELVLIEAGDPRCP